MATKEVKQNLEQCSVIAVAGATIVVAVLEQGQRKPSAGYLQNCDIQFPNLTHVRPRLLFTLILNYKKGRASHKRREGINIRKIKRKRRKQSEFKGTNFASVKNPTELFGFNLHRYLLVIFLTL